MSLPLVDFRGKITAETHAALEARARATGKDMLEIHREMAHEWALAEIRAASLLYSTVKREGLTGADEGAEAK